MWRWSSAWWQLQKQPNSPLLVTLGNEWTSCKENPLFRITYTWTSNQKWVSNCLCHRFQLCITIPPRSRVWFTSIKRRPSWTTAWIQEASAERKPSLWGLFSYVIAAFMDFNQTMKCKWLDHRWLIAPPQRSTSFESIVQGKIVPWFYFFILNIE